MRLKLPSRILLILILALFSPSLAASPAPLPTPELLKKLISIDTTNPPGNETELARWVQGYLKGFDIDSEILESAPGRGNLVARISGQGKREPLLILGHLDVVPADPKEWKFPPFQPTEENGMLYGRGAIDMKGMVALEIQVFLQIKERQADLMGDVILALVADEESGGKFGAGFLVREHWDKVKAAAVFNEGSIGLIQDGLHLWPIQVAEKGVAWLKVTATGTSGHGSMPIRDNAVLRLIQALDKISRKPQPIIRTPIVEAFLSRLSEQFSFPKSFILRNFFSWPVRHLAGWFFSKKIEKEKILNAMVRNTIVPTVLLAGSKTNVIPATASAQIDCRILPGETPEGFRKKLEATIDDPTIQLEWITQSLPNESPFDTPSFAALEAAIREQDPEAMVAPYISPGATDNRFFREKGVPAYGIIPILIGTEELAGLHGKNERIPLAELARGEKILLDFIWRLQGDPKRPPLFSPSRDPPPENPQNR